ncbi:DUF1304 family protein [Kribbella sp.]|uniref:DUF1304 family protein n=1 Tax=Kribbella sp. TaxID=1871183 RepID=UPI002D518266|nr:DUF1304 family protein [Kribbella sp.]HZX06325.1 DUF1304 family protein [Kribbella sp.]
MSTAAQILAIAIAVMLASVWLMESFFYRNPRLYPLFLLERRDFDAVRLWIVNLGFYNLTTGVALALGVVLVRSGHVPQGEALVAFTAGQHVFLALVLLATERRLWTNTLLEGVPALILLILVL